MPFLPPWPILFGCFLTVVIYALIRWFFWRPTAENAVEQARSHAFWTAFIALIVSWINASPTPGKLDPVSGYFDDSGVWQQINQASPALPDPWQSGLWLVISPIAAFLGVYLLGQLSFPKPRDTIRSAEVGKRRILDFLPKRLAIFTGIVFAFCAFLIGGIFTAPGFPPSERPSESYSGGSESTSTLPGRLEGSAMASMLWLALGVLAIGVVLVLWMIARRRSLEHLSPKNNATLRTISMNRLLRIAMLSTLTIISVERNYAWIQAPVTGDQPWQETTSWGISFNVSVPISLVILLSIIFWQPPRLQDAYDLQEAAWLDQLPAQEKANRFATSYSNAVRYLMILVVVLLAACCFVFALNNYRESAPILGGLLICALGGLGQLILICAELLIHSRFSAVGAKKSTTSFQSLAPYWLGFSVLGSIAVLFVTIIYAASSIRDGGWPLLWLFASGVLILGALSCLLATRRAAFVLTSSEVDRNLRRVTAFRALRLCCATFLALSGQLILLVNGPGNAQISPSYLGFLLIAGGITFAVIPSPRQPNYPRFKAAQPVTTSSPDSQQTR